MRYNNLYKHKETGKYYKIDYSAKPMVEHGKSFKDILKNVTITKYLFRPVKKGFIFLKESGLGNYDRLDNYIKVNYYGE